MVNYTLTGEVENSWAGILMNGISKASNCQTIITRCLQSCIKILAAMLRQSGSTFERDVLWMDWHSYR